MSSSVTYFIPDLKLTAQKLRSTISAHFQTQEYMTGSLNILNILGLYWLRFKSHKYLFPF